MSMLTLTPTLTSVSTFISSHPHLALLETQCTAPRDLRKLHAHFIKTGLITDTIAASRVLASASIIDVNYAYLVFARIQKKNLFIWNTIIRAFANSSRPEIAIELFVEMLVGGEAEPTRLTYPSVFKAYAGMGVGGWDGKQVHGRVLKLGIRKDSFVRNTLIHMYMSCGLMFEARKVFDEMTEFEVVAWNSMIMGLGKNGEVDEARRLFEEMGFRNVVTWNSMISGYVRNGEFAAALELFGKMMVEGTEKIGPCEFTMVSLLNACAHLGALRQGKWIHHYMKKKHMKLNSLVLTAIIDMYCKCGCIERAVDVFNAATDSERGLSCWNTMILGLAMNGCGDEAIGLFTRLELSNLTPDHVSFLGVLTACNHSGSVDEALKYFSSMISTYNLKPAIKHYTCLVDALGRTGCLREAEELIEGMPVEPDSIIWSSLLSSCRKHGEIEKAERAAKSLLKLDPGDACGYVLMSNVYSSSNRFQEAMEQRLAMRKKKAEKDPGCSMISVDGEVHEFISGGRLHPQSEQIYNMLHLLLKSMYKNKQATNQNHQTDNIKIQ